ncbi:ankyrin repeat and MYND domain-containing protein 2 [Neocloeon triangulifer]|uniref:ankyrin repeat and MYND domain-containing protein 2 n=1 Tax=Neocloeon triangulifer TaxID=2078957 RepID=UPI00286EED92|nr:ankyrin repeat and MYND domain-containing protein 2 [Neocloeon triangulifer]
MELSEEQLQASQKVTDNDSAGLQAILSNRKFDIDFVDSNGMTLLQHAVYKGNKEIAQLLIDQGADVNSGKHEHNYSALHFAALSGKEEVCSLLLQHGAKSQAFNSVKRTPAQMAAFVGNHGCVAAINNFIPRSEIDYFITPKGLEKEPKLDPSLADPLHKFVMQVNIHPVGVLMYLQNSRSLVENHKQVKSVLGLMCEKEMKRGSETNEVLSFKFHWLLSVLEEIAMAEESEAREKDKDRDVLDICIKKLIKPTGLDQFVRISVRRFPFMECTLFMQIANGIASAIKDPHYEPGCLISVVTSAINGHRGFATDSQCSACGNEKANRRCSRCKKEVYCGPECQKVHWGLHKKTCTPAKAEDKDNKSLQDTDKANIADLVSQQLSQTLEVK